MAESTETTISSVEHDMSSDWFTVVTPDGKFSTRIREKADEALALRGKRVTLEFTEQIKSKDGRQYRNRYYERAHAAAEQQQAGGFVETSGARPTHPDASWRMSLGVGAKCATAMLPLMAPEEQTFEVARELAFAWAHLIEFTARPTVVEAIQAPPPRRLAAVPGAYSEPEGIEAPPPHTDDDIPY